MVSQNSKIGAARLDHCHERHFYGEEEQQQLSASNTKKRQRSFTNPMKEKQPQHFSNGEDARKTAITECMSNLSIVDGYGSGSGSGDVNHEHTVPSPTIATAVTNHDMTPTAILSTRNFATTSSDARPPRRHQQQQQQQQQQRRKSYEGGRRPNVTNLYMLQHRQLNSPAARLGLQMLMYKHPSNSRRNDNNNRRIAGSRSVGTHPSSSAPAPSPKSRFMNSIVEDNYYPSLDEGIDACTSSEKRQRVKSVLSSSSW